MLFPKKFVLLSVTTAAAMSIIRYFGKLWDPKSGENQAANLAVRLLRFLTVSQHSKKNLKPLPKRVLAAVGLGWRSINPESSKFIPLRIKIILSWRGNNRFLDLMSGSMRIISSIKIDDLTMLQPGGMLLIGMRFPSSTKT